MNVLKIHDKRTEPVEIENTLEALKKLPASQRNKIYKLGGMKP